MNRFLPLLLFSVLFASMAQQTCFADGDDTQTIYIEQTGDFGDTPIIRSPGSIPIEAVYYPLISTIVVNFLNDLGSVSVEIENVTTGAYSQAMINATQGVHPFMISGTAGYWTITFTLLSGTQYVGEFEIY